MKIRISALTFAFASLITAAPASAGTTTITTTVSSGVPPRAHVSLVSTATWHKVLRVHICEEGNARGAWHIDSPKYAGGLGWLWATWTAYRLPWMPLTAVSATPQEQALAMTRFVRVALHGVWPDTRSCHGY